MKGWHNESYRHSLAARGIPTRIFEPAFQHPEFKKYNKSEVIRLVEGTIEYYDWTMFKDAPEDQRKWFYDNRVKDIFIDVSYEDFIEFVDSGKKFFEIKGFDLIGSRYEGYFRKDSDIDFLIFMELTDDGFDLISKDPEWEDVLGYHIEKIEEDTITGEHEWSYLENVTGKKIPVDAFLSVDTSKFKPEERVDWYWVDKNDVEEIIKRARKEGFKFRENPVVIPGVFPRYEYHQGGNVKSEVITLLTTSDNGPNIISLDDVIKEVDVSDLEE